MDNSITLQAYHGFSFELLIHCPMLLCILTIISVQVLFLLEMLKEYFIPCQIGSCGFLSC